MNGIAKAHSLCFGNICISGRLPELEEINLDVDVRLGEAGVLKIAFHIVTKLCFSWFLLKLRCAVKHGDFLIRTCMLHSHNLLRQLKECTVLRVLPIGMHPCDHVFNASLHRKVDEVLTVDDFHTVVASSSPM